MDHGQPDEAQQHEEPPPDAVDGGHGDDREHHVDHADAHDLQQGVGDGIAGGPEQLGRVVEDHVHAAPLLEDRQDDAEGDDPEHLRLQEVAEVDLLDLAHQRGLDVGHLLVGEPLRRRSAPARRGPGASGRS